MPNIQRSWNPRQGSWKPNLAPIVVFLSILLAACGPASKPTDQPSPSPSESPSPSPSGSPSPDKTKTEKLGPQKPTKAPAQAGSVEEEAPPIVEEAPRSAPRRTSQPIGPVTDCDRDGLQDDQEVDYNGDGVPDDCIIGSQKPSAAAAPAKPNPTASTAPTPTPAPPKSNPAPPPKPAPKPIEPAVDNCDQTGEGCGAAPASPDPLPPSPSEAPSPSEPSPSEPSPP